MSKLIINPDGTLEKKEASAKEVLNKLASANRKSAQALKEFANTRTVVAGAFALKKVAEEMGAMDGDNDADDSPAAGLFGETDAPAVMEGAEGGVDAAIDALRDAVEGLSTALGSGEDFQKENLDALDFNEGSALDSELDKAASFKVQLKKAHAEALTLKSAFNFDKKDDKKDKKDDKGKDKDEKGKEKDKDKDDKKASSLDSIVDQISSKLAEMRGLSKEDILKAAQEWPPKDLNTVTVENTNAQTTADQNKAISSDGFAHPASGAGDRAESISGGALSKSAGTAMDAPKTGNEAGIAQAVDGPYDKTKSIATGADSKYPSTGADKISMEEANRRSAHEVRNTIDKMKLSVELASQQQLKGLLDNPLKTAFVNEMVSAGIDKQAAEDIAYNAFIEGYEKNQSVVIAELDTFMNKTFDDFVKVAKYTKEYVKKEAVDGSDDLTRTAGEDFNTRTAALRPSSSVGNSSSSFSGYWGDVSNKNRKW